MKIIEKALETLSKTDFENLLKEYFGSDFEIDNNDGLDVWIEGAWLSEDFEKKQSFRNWLVKSLNLNLPRRFKVKTDNCDEIFESEDMESAKEWAENWLEDGDYGDDPCYVDASVVELDEDDKEIGCPEDVEIEWEGNVTIPECDHEDGHDWQEPHEVVGGCKENPGVYGLSGSQIQSTSVCSNCGMYRIYTSASTPSNHPKEPEKYEYRDADESSMKWIISLKKD